MSAHGARRVDQQVPRMPAVAPAAGMRKASSVGRHPRRQGGFTLLEVIAAIMLLAIAFTALMKVAGASIALAQNAATRSAAAMLARSKLDTVFVTTPLQVGHSAGRFDRQFAWQLDVTPGGNAGGAAPGSLLQLYQLDLNVTWGPSSHPRSARFRTLRLASVRPVAATASGQQP
jgi:general secretion pathway protein I